MFYENQRIKKNESWTGNAEMVGMKRFSENTSLCDHRKQEESYREKSGKQWREIKTR